MRFTTSVVATLLVLSSGVALAQALLHDVTGNWTFSVVTENGTGTPAVTLKQTGDKVTGTYESRMMGQRAFGGSMKGDSIMLTLEANGPEGIALAFRGVVVGTDSLRGLVDFGGMGGATFSAVRVR